MLYNHLKKSFKLCSIFSNYRFWDIIVPSHRLIFSFKDWKLIRWSYVSSNIFKKSRKSLVTTIFFIIIFKLFKKMMENDDQNDMHNRLLLEYCNLYGRYF